MIDANTVRWPNATGEVFEPTFPLDADEMRARVLTEKVASPGSWLAVGAIAFVAVAVAKVSVAGAIVGAAGSSLLLLRWWWKKIDSRVRRSVELELIAESNRIQNERLSSRMRSYRVRGNHHLAAVVEGFLSAKRKFESRLGREGSHYSTHENMENLVDHLCIGVCRELEVLSRSDIHLAAAIFAEEDEVLNKNESRRRRHLGAIRDAYRTLIDAAEALRDGIPRSAKDLNCSGPGERVREKTSDIDTLRGAIDEMRRESAISRGVRTRLNESTETFDKPCFDGDWAPSGNFNGNGNERASVVSLN